MTTGRRFRLPSRRWLFLPPLLVGLVTVGLLLRSRQELERSGLSERAVPASVMRAELRPVAPTAVGYGTAMPLRSWNCIAEVGGTIESIHPLLESGNQIEAGSLLVQIDPRDYQLRVDQRKADLEVAEARVAELSASEQADRQSLAVEQELLKILEAEQERLRGLRSTRAASQSEFDRARTEYLRQQRSIQNLRNSLSLLPARIAAARAQVSLAEAALAEAERQLERTRIVAPFSGRLSGVTIEPGQVVTQGRELFSLLDLETIEIEAKFALSQLLPLQRALQQDASRQSGLSTLIEQRELQGWATLRSGETRLRWPAKPVRLSESVDTATRTLGVIVQIDNRPGEFVPSERSLDSVAISHEGESAGLDERRTGVRLHPGAYAEVRLRVSSAGEGIVLPLSAISNSTVLVLTEDNRLQRRRVELAYSVPGGRVIATGIRPGERIVIEPPVPAIDGMLIDPQFAAGDPATISLTADTP